MHDLLDGDCFFWRSRCEGIGVKRPETGAFNWRTTFRAERFINRNFGDVQPVIALIGAAGFGVTEIVEYIIVTRDISVNAQSDAAMAGYTQVGSSALHSAANHNRIKTIQFLIGRGANLNAMDANGRTPLMLAVSHGHIPSCQLLLEAGSQPDLSTHFGFTALHFAAMIHSYDLVNLLVISGAEVNKKDQRGWTPAMLALNSAHTSNQSHNFQINEASELGNEQAAAALRIQVEEKNLTLRRTLARLILAGSDFEGLADRAQKIGFEEISMWLLEFIRIKN